MAYFSEENLCDTGMNGQISGKSQITHLVDAMHTKQHYCYLKMMQLIANRYRKMTLNLT